MAGTQAHDPAARRRRSVAFLAYPEHQPLDLVGPLQVFALANREGAKPLYEIVIVAERPGRVDAASGPSLFVDHGIDALHAADTLVIPGGPGVTTAAAHEELVGALREAARSARRVCSVCTGAFLLARAGALAGKRATTHWRDCAELARQYPDITVLDDPIFVRDGSVWTSAGVTAGIDLALALVEDDCGQELAARVARNLVVYLRRPGGQAQFSEPLALQQQSGSDRYGRLLAQVTSRLRRSWSIDELAAAAGQSPRTFQRQFRREVGQSPATAVELLRVTHARLLLETTSLSQSIVAHRCGFRSPEHMRRAFRRRLGVTPGSVRELFGTETGR